jgi:hypothetical protein
VTRLGRPMWREKRAFLQPFHTQSRYVMAVCWWDVAEAAASNRRIKPSSPPSTVTRLSRPILPRVHSRERRSLPSVLSHQKPVCSGGLLVGGRRGCSQQLQDQADITPVNCDPSRPADPAQSAPRREKKPYFSPFTPKAGMFWRSAGGRSPRLQPAITGSSRHHPRQL